MFCRGNRCFCLVSRLFSWLLVVLQRVCHTCASRVGVTQNVIDEPHYREPVSHDFYTRYVYTVHLVVSIYCEATKLYRQLPHVLPSFGGYRVAASLTVGGCSRTVHSPQSAMTILFNNIIFFIFLFPRCEDDCFSDTYTGTVASSFRRSVLL